MVRHSVEHRSAEVVVAIGATLFLASVAHHATEIGRIDRLNGPMLALALDGTLSLAVVYGGYRLGDSGLDTEHQWRAVQWCAFGIAVLVGTTAVGILIRQFEGRVVSEPTFQLLLAADAGAAAGLIAGYYNGRTHANARQADRATATLRFVNDLFRHDVRNHMSAIFAHADIVRSETDDETVAESATIIREQAEDVTALVENAGAIVETVSNGGDVGRIDLVPVVEDCAEQVAETYDATVETDLPERALAAANGAVKSVVANLAENAVEHNDADDPWVELSVSNHPESVRLRVADNGPGIADSFEDALFESDGERGGGGLHLVATLVENYGGDLWVEDSDVGGAAFVVELPRRDDE